MKSLMIPALLASLLASASVYANEEYDLKCTLDSGEKMMLSHSSDTVYISFKALDDDSDEGGSVIKLDIPSGEAQQAISKNSTTGVAAYTLRGTGDDIEGAISVVYEEYDGKREAYFSTMNALGSETANHPCKTNTIQVSNNLIKKGIAGVNGLQSNESRQPPTQEPEASIITQTSPVKIGIGQRVD